MRMTDEEKHWKDRRETLYKSLLANNFTPDAAWLLACLVVDVERLKAIVRSHEF